MAILLAVAAKQGMGKTTFCLGIVAASLTVESSYFFLFPPIARMYDTSTNFMLATRSTKNIYVTKYFPPAYLKERERRGGGGGGGR